MPVTECTDCGRAFSYHRGVCPGCGGETRSRGRFLEGRVYSTSTVHRAPATFESEVPYTVALVICDVGVNVLARTDGVAIEDRVVVGIADMGEHADVPCARPAGIERTDGRE